MKTMNKTIFTVLAGIALSISVHAQEAETVQDDARIDALNDKIEQLNADIQRVKTAVNNLTETDKVLADKIASLEVKTDSAYKELEKSIAANMLQASAQYGEASQQIRKVNDSAESNYSWLKVTGLWAIVALLAVAVLVYCILRRRIAKSKDAISGIREAQEKLKEESVALDTKLVELFDRQIKVDAAQQTSSQSDTAPVDHSLVLKVADEITRIEKNLLRMDESVKGYKPLVKAIERIKDNFRANGYEIVTYLGQPYNEGMRVNAEFVIDEELPAGTRTITSVSKPQVHYRGELIQKASVTVTQNI